MLQTTLHCNASNHLYSALHIAAQSAWSTHNQLDVRVEVHRQPGKSSTSTHTPILANENSSSVSICGCLLDKNRGQSSKTCANQLRRRLPDYAIRAVRITAPWHSRQKFGSRVFACTWLDSIHLWSIFLWTACFNALHVLFVRGTSAEWKQLQELVLCKQKIQPISQMLFTGSEKVLYKSIVLSAYIHRRQT